MDSRSLPCQLLYSIAIYGNILLLYILQPKLIIAIDIAAQIGCNRNAFIYQRLQYNKIILFLGLLVKPITVTYSNNIIFINRSEASNKNIAMNYCNIIAV